MVLPYALLVTELIGPPSLDTVEAGGAEHLKVVARGLCLGSGLLQRLGQ